MERFKSFLEQYNRELIEERSESFDGMIVQALIRLHDEGRQDISSKDIANRMIEDFGLEKVSPQSIGKHLKSLKIETKLSRLGEKVGRNIVWDNDSMKKITQRYVIIQKTDSSNICNKCNDYNRGELTNVTTTQDDSVVTSALSPNANVTNVTNVTHIVSEEKQSIEHACNEWESNHQEKLNSTNFTKACFDLKLLFPDITADDLANMIRKIAKITPTNSNSDKPPLKKGKEIEIPFNDWSLDRLKAGKKTATSRTKKYGNPGDLFRVGDEEYVLTAITEKSLKEIAEHYFKAEGAESSDEFIEVWRSIHRKKGFVPDQIVFYHEFANTQTNGNGSEDSDQKNPQHHCYVCGALPAKNESISSMGVKKYYCNPCYYQKYPFFVDNSKGEL